MIYTLYRENVILTRRYSLSGSTYLTLGIAIAADLTTHVKTFLHNKHDFFIELPPLVLNKLFDDVTKKRVKEYFLNRGSENSIIKLDSNVSLHFVKIFEKNGIALKDHSRNIQISFLNSAASHLMNLKHVVNCYLRNLELARSDVTLGVTKVKVIFDNYFYISDEHIVRKIFKSSEHFDSNNIIELELIGICHKRFLAAIEKEKKDMLVELDE